MGYHKDPVDGEYPNGTVAYFNCNDQYMRIGTLMSTCQESGTWSPEIPTCEEGIATKISKMLFTFNEQLLNLNQLHEDKNTNLFFYSDLYSNKFAKWVVHYNTTQEDGRYMLNTVATFFCDSQSNLSGFNSSTCQASNNSAYWIPEAPTCNLSNESINFFSKLLVTHPFTINQIQLCIKY